MLATHARCGYDEAARVERLVQSTRGPMQQQDPVAVQLAELNQVDVRQRRRAVERRQEVEARDLARLSPGVQSGLDLGPFGSRVDA